MKNEDRFITRRDFMRGTVGAALGASLSGSEWAFGTENKARSSLVTVVRNEKVMDAEGTTVDAKILSEMLDQAVMLTTGEKNAKDAWLRLVKPKDTVGIVPSMNHRRPRNPTHRELYNILVSSLKDIGIPENQIKNVEDGPNWWGLDTCTALISLPALKAHWLTGIGTVFKNYIMFSGRPTHYHEENSAKLGEIWHQPNVKGKTKLVLVDALFPLYDKGPQVDPRYQWAYNGLIAGTDPVAVETVCVPILEEKRRVLRGEPWPLSPPPLCLEAADRVYHLGTSNLDKIKIQLVGWQKDHLLPI